MIINTSTTIVTFLMVFLIQNTQTRDSEALQIKLDELLRVTKGAHKALMSLEELGQKEFDQIRKKYKELADHPEEEPEKDEEDPNTTND